MILYFIFLAPGKCPKELILFQKLGDVNFTAAIYERRQSSSNNCVYFSNDSLGNCGSSTLTISKAVCEDIDSTPSTAFKFDLQNQNCPQVIFDVEGGDVKCGDMISFDQEIQIDSPNLFIRAA